MTKTGHISKLHLFAKDTDAPDVIKGFKYQELKTLEVWLYNKVHGIDEHIYCDFEDDIFQRDLKSFKSTFKQLKLYSSKNFSFASEEIIKSLAHFFMLFVKGEYLLDQPLFIFETNTSIAAKRGDNDAELLEEWVSKQDNLSSDLLSKCTTKLKAIIDSYVNEQYENIKSDGGNEEILLAKDVYDKLPKDIWETFAKSIRWVFDGISSEKAIEVSIENSFELIRQLPFPISKDELSLVFDRLRGVVGDKSMESDPQNRLLTNDLLDNQLLSLGDKDDKIYLDSYELWKNVEDIQYFNIGEFYQVLLAAKHCRRNSYLGRHSKLWLKLLSLYSNHPAILRKLKREAIYEIVWLTLRPSVDEAPNNSLKGLEEIVQDYFSDLDVFLDLGSLEDALNLLTVTATTQKLNLIDIEEDQVFNWFGTLDSLIDAQKASAADRNIYCGLLELQGFSFLNKDSIGIGSENKAKALSCLNEIISESSNAPQYAISQLGKRIDAIVDLAIRFGLDDKFLELEQYSEELLPLVQEREGDFSAAKRYTEKGWKHLHSTSPKGILKALDFFHKAKDLYQNEATYEGFILAIMGISQLYAAIGMNLAAKYYSLSSIWFCFQKEDSLLYKRISDSYALLLHSDFKQGSWISYLQAFENYVTARNEFDSSDFDPETDELLRKTLVECAFIMGLTPIISNQLSGFIDYEKTRMGQLYDDFLKESVEYIQKEQHSIGLNELVARKLENPPINDIGSKRTIMWKAFGSHWNIEFENDFISGSVGEEFAALIQIIQSEIALSEIDFHLTEGRINIKIELVETPKGPEQLPSNSEYLWKVFLPVLKSKEPKEKNIHYASITVSFQMILNELSLLPYGDFQEKFHSLFKAGLGNKALTINAYQRAYRDLVSENKFNESMRNKFTSELLNIEQHESETLSAKKNDSPLYNHDDSINNIKGRYKNCLGVIHLTLDRLKQSREFSAELSRLKDKGWLDWQIILALYNIIVDLKVKNLLAQNGKTYKTEEEWIEDFQKTFHEIRFKNESETYVEIPISELIGQNLEFQLNHLSTHVLKSYGLENKSRFPIFEALRSFLNERFRFREDEVEELSPFYEKK
jgi:polyhydroxyalkanoate synthesis regulator phasin